MEMKKKNHPSLPPNYVTLAQLQERWLKQHQQIDQPQQQHEEKPRQHPMQQNLRQQRDRTVVVPRNETASRSHRAKVYPRKIRSAVEVAGDDRRKSEAGDGKADPHSEVSESKKNKEVKLKPKVERGAASEDSAAAQGNEDSNKETTIEGELKNKKSGDSVTVEEAEQKIGDLSVNYGKGKQNKRSRRMNEGFRHSQPRRNGPKVERGEASEDSQAAQGKEDSNKETELKNEKSGDSVTVEEVEQKFGDLSVNSGNGKRIWRSRRMNDGFRHSQPQRNGSGYGHSQFQTNYHVYGYGYGGGNFGGQQYRAWAQRRDKMVWVKKDEIET